MSDAWQILCDAGLPMSSVCKGTSRDVPAIAGAVRDVMPSAAGREAEALAAFILAWRGHWPSSFAGVLGDREIAWAEQHRADAGRYLKLRRIAIANLAHIL